MKILVATDFSMRSQRALRRAGRLARESGSELTIVYVVDDDRPTRLVEIDRREAERYLAEQIESISELRGLGCRAVVVSGDAFDGILRTAQSTAADLIVMGAHRKQFLRDIFIGTTIERVIRTGPFPVLMVNNEAGCSSRRVLAAVKMAEPSVNAIKIAKALGLIDNGHLTLVHGFQTLAKGHMSIAGLERNRIDEHAVEERLRAGTELRAYFEASALGVDGWALRVREGGPFEVISRTVQEALPDLLIIGTHGRTGVVKVLLGSVTEEVLRSIETDILAVPLVR